MADNTTLNSGSGGDTIASDDIAGVKYQRVKLTLGADGVNDGDVASGNALPVSGTVTANLGATDNAVLDDIAAQALAIKTAVEVLDNAIAGSEMQVDVVSVPAPLSTTGGGTEATALRVTLASDSTGVVSVDDNGGSITIDAPVGTPAFVRLSDGAAAITTLPVSLASVPSHAVTNAGTFGVQENGAALTALQLLDDAVATLGTTTYTEAATKGLTIGAVRRDADTTLVGTTNEIAPLQVDANGRLKVEAFSGETLPVSLASVPSHAVTNAGTFATQLDGAALTALQLIDDSIFADDAAFTVGTSKVTVSGGVVDETSTDSADEGDAAALRVTATRQLVTTVRPTATGEGLDIFRSLDLDETEEDVKASAGKVYGWYVFNAAATTHYLKFYNAAAASVTVGTTTPVMTIPIPAGSAANVEFTNGIPFSTAICVAATTGVADSDTGAPAANAVVVNILYK